MSYFGYSQLAMYAQCPRRFKFTRMDKRAVPRDPRVPYIGNVLGRAVSRFYIDKMWKHAYPRESLRTAIVEEADYLNALETYPWYPGERATQDATAVAAVEPILTVIRDNNLVAPVIDLELQVEVQITPTDKLVGSADLVLTHRDDTITLLDIKGGGSIGKNVKTNQLRLYQLGIGQHPRYRRLPTRVGFWWVRHGKIVWKRTPKPALKRFVEGTQELIARLRMQDFAPTPGEHCKWCHFRNTQDCPEGMETLTSVRSVVPSADTTGYTSL